MGFGERIKRAFQKIKTKLIVFGILTIIILLWLVSSVVCSWKQGFEGVPAGQVYAIETVSNGGEENLVPLTEEEAFIKFGSKEKNKLDWSIVFIQLGWYIVHPWHAVGLCISEPAYAVQYGKAIVITVGLFSLAVVIGFVKALPKHEFDDIEHGSSDWSENGEQYQVLNKKEGIVLAEKNYLPVDKRGNVNVLVVGRIWCW